MDSGHACLVVGAGSGIVEDFGRRVCQTCTQCVLIKRAVTDLRQMRLCSSYDGTRKVPSPVAVRSKAVLTCRRKSPRWAKTPMRLRMGLHKMDCRLRISKGRTAPELRGGGISTSLKAKVEGVLKRDLPTTVWK